MVERITEPGFQNTRVDRMCAVAVLERLYPVLLEKLLLKLQRSNDACKEGKIY